MIAIMPQLAVARVANGYVVVPNIGSAHVVLCATKEQALELIDLVLTNATPPPLGLTPTSEYGKMLDDMAAGLKLTPDALRSAVKEHHFGISPWSEPT